MEMIGAIPSLSSLLLFIGISTFILSYFLAKWAKKYFEGAGIIAEDVHKEPKRTMATSGGIPVFLAFFIATMLYTAISTYLFKSRCGIEEIFAGVLAIFFVTLVGFIDDINVKGAKRIGLKQWQKPLLTLFAALPIMALNINRTFESFRFIPAYAYSLIIAPLGFVGASNMVNMLAGLNGLEAGIGIITIGTLAVHVAMSNTSCMGLSAIVIAIAAISALAGFLMWNFYPAKFLPGDSLTYFIGAVIGIVAIFGNVEKAGLIISIPFFIEFILKARGKFKKPTVGYAKNGKIYKAVDGIYSIPHLFMNGKMEEWQITLAIYAIFLIFAAISFLV